MCFNRLQFPCSCWHIDNYHSSTIRKLKPSIPNRPYQLYNSYPLDQEEKRNFASTRLRNIHPSHNSIKLPSPASFKAPKVDLARGIGSSFRGSHQSSRHSKCRGGPLEARNLDVNEALWRKSAGRAGISKPSRGIKLKTLGPESWKSRGGES